MNHWTEDVLTELVRSLDEEGIEVTNLPSARPELLESIALAGSVEFFLKNGFVPVGDTLDLSHTNHLPYRRVTQGSGMNQRATIADLRQWTSPIFEVERGEQILSFFREGTPFLRSRDRPDLLVYDTSFDVEKRSNPFIGEHVIVSWDGERSGKRRYKRETDANGPIITESTGSSASPILGVEVSLNKSCERLKQQIDLLQDLGCKNAVALLEHENPCPTGELQSKAKILTADGKQVFYSDMEQIGTQILQGIDP